MSSKLIVPLVVGALIVGGGSFYGGTQYAKSAAPNARGFAAADGTRIGRGGMGMGGGQGRNGGGFTSGEVAAKDATSLTVKLRDGSSKIIFYSSSTTVGKMAAGSLDDVTQGSQVMIVGTSNSDGSIAASSIQIRPTMPSQPTSDQKNPEGAK